MIKFLHMITEFVAKLFANVHSPWTHKKISYSDVLEMESVLEIGDIILTRTNGELTTLLIPGFWKHAAIYVGNGKIIDATRSGVSERYLVDLTMVTDNVCVKRLSKANVGYGIVSFAKMQLNKPYDYGMYTENLDALYCSELVYHAVNYATGCNYLDLRKRMGVSTFTPEDCYAATKKFDLIWEKRSK